MRGNHCTHDNRQTTAIPSQQPRNVESAAQQSLPQKHEILRRFMAVVVSRAIRNSLKEPQRGNCPKVLMGGSANHPFYSFGPGNPGSPNCLSNHPKTVAPVQPHLAAVQETISLSGRIYFVHPFVTTFGNFRFRPKSQIHSIPKILLETRRLFTGVVPATPVR